MLSVKRLFIVSVLFAFTQGNAQSQSRVLEGLVLDSETNRPLQGATCVFENYDHIGAVTDGEGGFQIQIPVEMSADVLTISFLGYESQRFVFRDIVSSDVIYVRLNRVPILLDEILIVDDSRKLKEMFLDAVGKISRNYPGQRHFLRGFYRKVSTEGSAFTHLLEAAIIIEDYSYKVPISSVRVEVITCRETPDWGRVDSIQLNVKRAVRQSASDNWNISANRFYRTYEGNFLRMFNNANNTFNYATLIGLIDKHYEFKMVGHQVVNGDTICQIAFSEGIVPPDPSGRNYFKINLTDMAITEFQFAQGLPDRLTYQTTVRFKKYYDRYYPEHIRVMQPRYITRNNEYNEYDIETFWFDQVEIRGSQRVKLRNIVDRLNDNLCLAPYDSDFWRKYTPLLEHPLDPQVLRSLEQHGSLEQQFENK